MEQERIILIGAGNVAHHLAVNLLKRGANLCQIYSRSLESARELGTRTGVSYTHAVGQIFPDGDVYLFCVSDDALQPLLKTMRIKNDPLLLHTSGTLPISLFKPYSSRYGVLYPLQTFSKHRQLDFAEIPVFIEGNTPAVLSRVQRIAEELTPKIYPVDAKRRGGLHLAAVFACNFPNFLYHLAGEMLKEQELDFSVLRPLIYETAHKVMTLPPEEAQTGPARRGDETVMSRHRNKLKNEPELQTLYSLLSELIRQKFTPEEEKEEEKPAAMCQEDNMPTLF